MMSSEGKNQEYQQEAIERLINSNGSERKVASSDKLNLFTTKSEGFGKTQFNFSGPGVANGLTVPLQAKDNINSLSKAVKSKPSAKQMHP